MHAIKTLYLYCLFSIFISPYLRLEHLLPMIVFSDMIFMSQQNWHYHCNTSINVFQENTFLAEWVISLTIHIKGWLAAMFFQSNWLLSIYQLILVKSQPPRCFDLGHAACCYFSHTTINFGHPFTS